MDYFIKDKILYHLGKLCIPQTERVNIIREAHTSLISGHFGVSKIVTQLQRFCYWPRNYKDSAIGQEWMRQFLDILKDVLCVLQASQVI